MKKLIKFVETKYEIVFLLMIVVISSLISLADFFGILNVFPWISDHIPTITLLFVSLALCSLSIAQIKHAASQEEVKQVLIDELPNHMSISLKQQVDSNLWKVFERYLTGMPEDFKRVVKENTIKFETENEEAFKYYYKLTLQKYPKATFLATSRPDSFLWKDNRVLDDTERFIRKGGKIIRIFFLNSNDELIKPEVQEVLEKQYKIQVEVYIAINVPTLDQILIAVESNSKIAWETRYNEQLQLTSAKATTNQQKTKEYYTKFKDFQRNHAHRYSPGAVKSNV
jgi:hypothetical protein